MWILFAAGSALFAGVTAILAKCGIRKTDSTVATAIRTLVVLVFAWTMVFVVGSQGEIRSIGPTTLLFLVLSGLATGASWLCYFKALQLGDINKVVPIDKSSTVLTILLAFFLLGEPIGLPQGIGVVLIGTGTFLMLEKRSPAAGCAPQCGSWMLYAFGSAVFASLTAILGKAGIQGVESNLGTAIRTGVVLVMAWLMVLVTGKAGAVRQVPRRELAFICLSGVATGASWLCYYRALQSGPASVVVPIDKLSILVTVAFSRLVFRERLTSRSAAGLALIVAGTLAMLFCPPEPSPSSGVLFAPTRCRTGVPFGVPPAGGRGKISTLVFFCTACYTGRGLRNAAKGGAPWRHAHIDDKNQIAREPVFQAERVPVRADRTRLPRRKRGHQHLREGLNGYVLMRRVPVLFCAEN